CFRPPPPMFRQGAITPAVNIAAHAVRILTADRFQKAFANIIRRPIDGTERSECPMVIVSTRGSVLIAERLGLRIFRSPRTEDRTTRHTEHSPPMTDRTWHATYVLYHHIADHLALGWMVAMPNAACHINFY